MVRQCFKVVKRCFFFVQHPDNVPFYVGYGSYGVGIHLLEGVPTARSPTISPMADHLSFHALDLDAVVEVLNELKVDFVKQAVVDNGVTVEQLFLHDPDHNMIEICNCESFAVCPIKLVPEEVSCNYCVHPESQRDI